MESNEGDDQGRPTSGPAHKVVKSRRVNRKKPQAVSANARKAKERGRHSSTQPNKKDEGAESEPHHYNYNESSLPGGGDDVDISHKGRAKQGSARPIKSTRKRKTPSGSSLHAESPLSSLAIDVVEDELSQNELEVAVVRDSEMAQTTKSPPDLARKLKRTKTSLDRKDDGGTLTKSESRTKPRKSRNKVDPSTGGNGEITSVFQISNSRNASDISSTGPEEVTPHSSCQNRMMKRLSGQTKISPSLSPYQYKQDPNKCYVEEEAYLYHDPPFPTDTSDGVLARDLRPIPPPSPMPTLPDSGSCRWTFDENSRVLVADFIRNSPTEPLLMDPIDSKFFFEMLERDDITVISRGLLKCSHLDSSLWNLDHISQVLGNEFYHKFRRFDRVVDKQGFETCSEKDTLYSMRFADYARYYDQRMTYTEAERLGTSPSSDPTFTFVDHMNKEHSINVRTTALYMIDVDMIRLMPWLFENFMDSFEMKAVLPGGSHCMMNSITSNARPFMGPNLYVTPPASFTHFHQDGHGTVDSGHLCISGYNEIVILRRLPERHKKNALWILTGNPEDSSSRNPRVFDGLYSEPHGDGLGEKPAWPSLERIEECKRMGYCPSVCILKPGDLIHINKGRLHAFRKMSTSKLREVDCHAEQRRRVIVEEKIYGEQMCISVAWDWMYRGVTAAGINRETLTILEASILNRKNGVTSLAVPELSLLQMAKTAPTKAPNSRQSFLSRLVSFQETAEQRRLYDASKREICKGILPGLCYVVDEHLGSLATAAKVSTGAAIEAGVLAVGDTTRYEKGQRLSLSARTDCQEDPMTCPLDPYGDSDFSCKLCRKELSNVYYHCDGCELLLSKDFNICKDCHTEQKYMAVVPMHPSNRKRHATLNHTGDMQFDRISKCPCKTGPRCNFCGYCLGCSCRCHTFFTVHARFYKEEDERLLLKKVEVAAGTTSWADSTPSCHIVDEDRSSIGGKIAVSSMLAVAPIQDNGIDVSRMIRVAHERLQHARLRRNGG